MKTTIGDIATSATIAEAMRDVNAVVHLAAVVSVTASERDPGQTRAVNTDGAVAVTRAALERDARLLFVSSAAVYGHRSGGITETEPFVPAGVYGRSKLDAEERITQLAEAMEGSIRIVRPFNVYGRGQTYRGGDSSLIAAVQRAISEGAELTVRGDGFQTRDFIHVDDVAGAIVRRILDDHADSRPVNIGTGVPRSVNDVLRIVEAITGTKIRRLHGAQSESEINESFADIRRLRAEDAKFDPAPLEKGLGDSFSWAVRGNGIDTSKAL